MPMYPQVPVAPGVPPVFRNSTNNSLGSPTPLTSDGPNVASPPDAAPQWGIFDSGGSAVIEPDSVISAERMREFRVSDFPIEAGGFASYNKVATPFRGEFRMVKGGQEGDRTAFLKKLDALVESLDLLTMVTPEISYDNVNVTHYEYRRTSENGVQLIAADIRVEEIRQAASAAFSNTQDPSSQDAQSNGAVQPVTPDTAQTSAAQSDLTTSPGVNDAALAPEPPI